MVTKSPIPMRPVSRQTLPPIVELYFHVNQLKQLYRQGWLRCGMDPAQCESVAEHTFGVALLAMVIADAMFPELDASRVLRMAVLHDIGEAVIGDVTPHDGVSRADKSARERAAVTELMGRLDGGERYLEVWEEYEAGLTAESQLVHQIDKLEMALQAAVYEHQHDSDLGEFFTSAGAQLVDERLAALMESVRRPSAENRQG